MERVSVPGDIRATFVRILAYLGGLALLAIVAAGFFGEPAALAPAAPAAPAWVNVERPYPAFELQMPELPGEAAGYAILRRPADGARKDILSVGAPAAAGPYLMVEIYRPGAASERFIDAPSEIAARIIAFTVTDDVKPAGEIDSKFGPVPLVDFAVGMPGSGTPRRCLGFAKAFEAPTMQIAGWYCNADDGTVNHATLNCALDRLTMLSAGGDARLAGLFARAEIRRTFCGARSPILAATPEREVAVPIPRSIKLARGERRRAHSSPR